MSKSILMRSSVIAACLLMAACADGEGGVKVGKTAAAAGTVKARPSRIDMSPAGARAHRALRDLSPSVGVRALREADAGGAPGDDDDDEGGFEDPDQDLPGGNQDETTVAVDDSGQHIVVGFNDARGFSLNPLSVSGFMYSDDGGKTFVDGGQLPVTTGTVAFGTTLTPQVFGDPDVVYLGECKFIYTSIVIAPFAENTNVVQTIGFHRSSDCGHTWEGPFVIDPASNPNGGFDGAGNPLDAADKEFADVDRASGRVLVSWTNFSEAVEISTTYSDDVFAAQPTWSPRNVLGARDIDGQSSIPRFGPPGSNLVYVAWRTFLETGAGESVARSTDNGATFQPPLDLSPDGFFPPDQILGNDRINWSPGLAVDQSHGRNRGNVYITYENNDNQDGGDVVVQRSTDQGRSFSEPIRVGPRPGNDRSQWFPWIETDDRTGRVHLYFFDQSVADNGDLTQMTYTFSDDGGRHWSAARRLSPKPWHAGWGNDTGQPNLGDYIGATVDRFGRFITAYVWSPPPGPGFRDGQPSGSMTVPTPIVTLVDGLHQLPFTTVDFQGLTATEVRFGSNRNGFIDPGEIAAVSLRIRNNVTNPLNARTINASVGIVESLTPGARVIFGVTAWPRLAPGQTATSLVPVLVQLDRGFDAGQDVELRIRVISATGLPTDLFGQFHTGTPAGTVLLSENFDSATGGALPAGWVSAHGLGANVVPWTTSTSFCGATSNTAFHVNAEDGVPSLGNNGRWERLIGPIVTVPANADYVTVEFDVCYDTEDDPAFDVQAFDGLFLRVFDATPGDTARSVLAEAFARDFFTDGFYGYPKHEPRSNNPFYFPDMALWAGDSGGFQHVRMRLPGMAGASMQLRFEYTQDANTTCADIRPGHTCGVALDNVVVTSVTAN